MRKSIIALVAAIGLCCALQQAGAQTEPQSEDLVKKDFEIVEKIGSRRAYEIFLEAHRSGPYADLARERLNKQRALDGRFDEILNRRLIEQQTK
jgi:hypothetical protein